MCIYPVQPVCTSLFILLFIKSTVYCIAQFILLHILPFIFNLYLYISSCVVLHILHCPLSGPDPIHISLLIIFCIIDYVTNKQTLNLETQQLEDQGPKIPTLHMKAQDKDKHITLTDEWIKRNHKWRRLLRSGQKNAVISSNSKAFSINTLIIKTHREPCHSHHHLKSHANMEEICVT